MPASPSRVITPCSMRPLGRPRRRGVEEPDGRDIVSCSERWPSRGPGARASQKHDAGPRGPASAMDSRSTRYSLRSEEHTSELQSRENLVCRLLLEKKKKHLNRLRQTENTHHTTLQRLQHVNTPACL